MVSETCLHIYLSRWAIRPLAHPPGATVQVDEVLEEARTMTGALSKMFDRYPQYQHIPCSVECLIPARKGEPK